MLETNLSKVAYFSMEIALEPGIPTYSGGLGVLAGDSLRSAADLGVPMAGVTLAHRRGYFRQRLDARGNQFEEDALWKPEELLEGSDARTVVEIEGRQVHLRAWKYTIPGVSGHEVPVYLLDADLAENTPWDRTLTDRLYGGDAHYRFCQEALLGIGGVRMLRELGYTQLGSYHMNEGHAALLALGLLEQRLGKSELGSASEEDLEAIRSQCIFTTHTPVPAGHDEFSRALMQQVLGAQRMRVLEVTHCCPEGTLNMTYLALKFSRYINGVAMHHAEISQEMYPLYPIRAITNGVHAVTWTAPAFRELYDRHIPEWRQDNLYLRYVRGISLDEIHQAHASAKRALLQEIQSKTHVEMEEKVFTIGFARRAAIYKRPELLLANGEHLRRMAKEYGPLQIVFGGKAHPQDASSKEMIRRVIETAGYLKDALRFVYVQDYDMRWAQLITSGVDLWLNTPRKPQEASGTSGMKAALNGVPSLSVLDGWWIEGHAEGATGWAIGTDNNDVSEDSSAEAASLYDKLEQTILPTFYGRPSHYTDIMRSTIALNGSFFNTQRMISQYVANAYFPDKKQSAHRMASADEKAS
ncbi:MAG: alpha-glucan family phosphorylase [Acidobacteriia bacterium]|nr:alpha-glucan family phosphorylase [Terriglobia bacterium]